MAAKRIIKYKDKNYELSTVYLENMYEFETMIFPIENGVVNGNEVYCFRTPDISESYAKHVDIINNISKYVSEETINEYLKSKEEETMEDANYVYIIKEEYEELLEYKYMYESLNK